MKRPALTTYRTLCTEFYDLELKGKGRDALAFYMAYARQAVGPILEPMCGTGRFLIPMLQEGLDAEGFDASEYMLEALQQNYFRATGRQAPVWQQFVQDFSSDKVYQLVFIPFGSWGLITEVSERVVSLQQLYKHLALGGRLILEIETIASVPYPCGIWRRGVHVRADGALIAINTLTSYDSITQLFQSVCRYELIKDNAIIAVETEDFKQYLFGHDELDEQLQTVGFSSIKRYKNYAKDSVEDLSIDTIIYECIK